MTREDIEAQTWIGEQRAAVVAMLDRAEKAEAERDEALLNCKRINEEEFMKRVNGGNGSSLTPLGKMLTGLVAAGDLLTAQLADVTRQRDECASGLLAMREALEAIGGRMLGRDAPTRESLLTDTRSALANPTAGAAWLEAKLDDATSEAYAACLATIEGKREYQPFAEALAEHDARVAAEAYEKGRVAERFAMMNENGLVVSAVAEARRAAIEEAAQVVSDCEVEGYEDRDRPTQVWHDSGHRTLMSAAAAVRALAPPAPAPTVRGAPFDETLANAHPSSITGALARMPVAKPCRELPKHSFDSQRMCCPFDADAPVHDMSPAAKPVCDPKEKP